jgi:hypothetical protein
VQFQIHDEKPLRLHIQPSSRAKRKGATGAMRSVLAA